MSLLCLVRLGPLAERVSISSFSRGFPCHCWKFVSQPTHVWSQEAGQQRNIDEFTYISFVNPFSGNREMLTSSHTSRLLTLSVPTEKYWWVYIYIYIYISFVNPFTAMLAAPSLGRRPIKVPSFKSLTPFFPWFAWTHQRIYIKMHCTESRFVIGPSNICLQACMWALFSPEMLQVAAVKGLIEPLPSKDAVPRRSRTLLP